MQRKLTITLDKEVHKGLHKVVGKGKIGKFLAGLARPYVVRAKLEAEYKAMAADRAREAGALEWAVGDAAVGSIACSMWRCAKEWRAPRVRRRES